MAHAPTPWLTRPIQRNGSAARLAGHAVPEPSRDAVLTVSFELLVSFGFPSLFTLSPTILNRAMITYFDTSNLFCLFVLGQKPSICR
jgi:hypothetical protein